MSIEVKWNCEVVSNLIPTLRESSLISENSEVIVSPLIGGMTNDSYLVSIEGVGKFVYRSPGLGTEITMDRHREAQVYSMIETLKLSDNVVYMNPKSGIKITEYISGARDLDITSESEVKTAMLMLRTLHTSELTLGSTLDFKSEIEKFRDLSIESGMIEPPTMKNLVDLVVDECTQYLDKFSHENVLCHVDPAAINFIMGSDEHLRLIDWEYSATSHPMLDLAMYTMYNGTEASESEEILEVYYSDSGLSTDEWHTKLKESIPKFHACKALAGIMWYYWTVHREMEGEEYGSYGGDQLIMSLASFDKYRSYLRVEGQFNV